MSTASMDFRACIALYLSFCKGSAIVSTRRYEVRVNDTTHNNAKPSQMMALPRLATSATNAGQANTTTEVAYLSSARGSAKWNARAIAAHKATRKTESAIGQRISRTALLT